MSGFPSTKSKLPIQSHMMAEAASANQLGSAGLRPSSYLSITAGLIALPILNICRNVLPFIFRGTSVAQISPQKIGNDILEFLIMQTSVSTGLKCRPNDIKTLMKVSKPLAEQFRNTTHSASINCSQYLKLKTPEQEKAHIDALKKDLSKYPNLTTLKLTGPVDNEILSALTQCTQLKTLDLSDCNNVGDDGLKHLANLTQLERLELKACKNITNVGLAHLAKLTQLQHLNLNGCRKITDVGIAHLAKLTQLQHLNLTWCTNMTDAGIAHLAYLTQLQHLNLNGCKEITDAGLANLKTLTKLQRLTLYGCSKLTRYAIETFKQNVSCNVVF